MMYVSINMDAMTVHHKHPEHDVVSGLATIELGHVAVCIVPVDAVSFELFTDLEIRLLHSHLNVSKPVALPYHRLIGDLLGLLVALPITNANLFEVQHQSKKIAKDAVGFYKYAPGSYMPKQILELFTPESLNKDSKPVVVKPLPVLSRPLPVPVVQPASQTSYPTWHPLYTADVKS